MASAGMSASPAGKWRTNPEDAARDAAPLGTGSTATALERHGFSSCWRAVSCPCLKSKPLNPLALSPEGEPCPDALAVHRAAVYDPDRRWQACSSPGEPLGRTLVDFASVQSILRQLAGRRRSPRRYRTRRNRLAPRRRRRAAHGKGGAVMNVLSNSEEAARRHWEEKSGATTITCAQKASCSLASRGQGARASAR